MEEAVKKARQYFTESQKRAILEELDSQEISISLLSRRYGIHPVTIYTWRRKMKDDKKQKSKELIRENEKLKAENELLKKVLAEASIEKYILQTANDILKKKEKKEMSKLQKKSSKSQEDS